MRIPTHSARVLAAVGVAGLVLSACGGSSASSSTSVSSKNVASKKHKKATHKAKLPSYSVTEKYSAAPTPHFPGYDQKLGEVFVSHLAAGEVTAMNGINGHVLATIHTGGVVHTVMVDNKSQMVYVTDIGQGYLDVINAKTNTLVHKIKVAQHLHGLAVSQRLHEAVVTDVSTSKIYVVSTKTGKVLTPSGIPVGANPWGVTIDAATKTAYVANTGMNPFGSGGKTVVNPAGDTVSVVNLATDTVTSTIKVGPHPWNLVFDPKNKSVYAGVAGAAKVAVISHGKLVKSIPVGAGPHGVALDTRNGALFVNDTSVDQVAIIDTRTNAVSQTLNVGQQPQGVAVSSKNGYAYVVNQKSQSLYVLTPVHAG